MTQDWKQALSHIESGPRCAIDPSLRSGRLRRPGDFTKALIPGHASIDIAPHLMLYLHPITSRTGRDQDE
jgi:hypothetical protein